LFTLTSYPKLPTPETGITNIDKLAHFSFYFIFALLFILMHDPASLNQTLRKLLKLALILPLIDELHQIPIPGRTFSIWDLLADLLGFSLVFLIFKIRLSKSNNPV
jgi:VanZ family protein